MRDTELYRQLLGLVAPWTVADVKLDVAQQRVDIWVQHADGTRFLCPECGEAQSVYDQGRVGKAVGHVYFNHRAA